MSTPRSDNILSVMAARGHLSIFILTIVHLALSQALAVLSLVFPSEALKAFLTGLARFPLTPLAIGQEFWEAEHRYDAVKALVSVSNSLVVGLLIVLCIKIFVRRNAPASPTRE